ncbi:MAG: type I 3-dehydroquinate dehydratase [Deltaproteobacteria bacterium]|nr:type I 3-dehydroquinate dehydratase [Deltaproteobacteria bacterium]
MICIPIAKETTAAAIAMIERAAPDADLMELRIDGMRDCDLRSLLKNRPRPVIVTNRRREEGGAFNGTEPERIARLAEAARLGADYIDCEIATPLALKEELRQICRQSGTQRIASWHDFSKTPETAILEAKLAEAMADDPALIKLITMANDKGDNLRLLSLLPLAKSRGRAMIAFCMGEMGQISRVMAPLFGSRISYAPLEPDGASAPGQLTAGRMREILALLADLAPAGPGRSGESPLREENARP